MSDSTRPPHRPTPSSTPEDGVNEHEAFVVDTRRNKGNRRATSPAPEQVAPKPRQEPASSERYVAPDDPDRETESAAPPASHELHRYSDAQGEVYIGGPNSGRAPSSFKKDRPSRTSGGNQQRPPGAAPKEHGKPGRRRRGKKVLIGVLIFALLWLGSLGWAAHGAWDKVAKVDALPSEHAANAGSGTNTLIVGSDGRAGLTAAQRKALGTGQADGQRTDSIMVLHSGGPKPTLMSIPRDSYVSIPGHMKNKINASFSLGGPELLIKTIEQNTGIHIDNYMEIGFGGFASVVNAVGGVDICVAHDMDDEKAHINLKKGCQTLNGANALGYVRARYSDPEGDIGRAKRQRQFLGALMKKISAPSNLLLPWKLKGLGESGAQGLSVDNDMSMFRAASVMWSLKGFSSDKGNSVSVPVGDASLYTPVGEVVQWDSTKANKLFEAIRTNGDTAPYVTKSTSTTPTN